VSLPERRTGLWRVAHYRDPLEFAPHDRCSWGHRFDDVERRHRTLYCASTPETALREVLADLRPNADAIAKHRKVYGAAATASLPKSAITEKWRQDNVLVPCTLLYEGRLLDLTDVHERHEIETLHAQLLAEHGMSHLDMHEVTTRRRIVTQTIATDAYDNLDVAAIRFASSRDGHACIALFENRAELEEAGPPIALTDPPPEPLVKVAADWKLDLSSAAPANH
jgi:RES domain